MGSTPSTKWAAPGRCQRVPPRTWQRCRSRSCRDFPTRLASTNTAFPFGIWFADANTLYVCDEGDGTFVTPAVNGNVADAQSQATAGLQKWRLINGTWVLPIHSAGWIEDRRAVQHPLSIHPRSIRPQAAAATSPGSTIDDGTVTIFAITSTISANGDTGADPNKLVKVTDRVSDTTLPTGGDVWAISRRFGVPGPVKCSGELHSLPGITTGGKKQAL